MNYSQEVWGRKKACVSKERLCSKAVIKDNIKVHDRQLLPPFWPKVMPLLDKPIHRRSTQESQCLASTMDLNDPHCWCWDLKLNLPTPPQQDPAVQGPRPWRLCYYIVVSKHPLLSFLLSNWTSNQTNYWIYYHIYSAGHAAEPLMSFCSILQGKYGGWFCCAYVCVETQPHLLLFGQYILTPPHQWYPYP